MLSRKIIAFLIEYQSAKVNEPPLVAHLICVQPGEKNEQVREN
jgi:hypothetical protein